MKLAKKIPIDELREHLLYDPITGIFTRKRQIKRPLGAVNDQGYLIIEWRDSPYRAHRIAWAWVYGECDKEIDHINGIKLDNRIVNLREATHAENNRNKGKTKANTSGYKGVSLYGRDQIWVAQIVVNGKYIYLGRYKNKEDAHSAYRNASMKYGGLFDYNTSQSILTNA